MNESNLSISIHMDLKLAFISTWNLIEAAIERKLKRLLNEASSYTDDKKTKGRTKKALKDWRPNSFFFNKSDIKGSTRSIQTLPSGSSLNLQTSEKEQPPTLQPPTLLVTLSPPSSEKSIDM